MDQFVVPQFIEVEDKIIGFVTVRQFLILLSGGVTIFLFFRFADFALFVLALILIGALSLVFAFVKINGQPFHYFILNITQTLFKRPTLRVWRKFYPNDELNYLRKFGPEEQAEKENVKTQVQREKIRDLSLLVNTGGFYRPEDDV